MTLELAPKRGMEKKNWIDEGANAKVNNETKQTETMKHKTADSMKFNFIFFHQIQFYVDSQILCRFHRIICN